MKSYVLEEVVCNKMLYHFMTIVLVKCKGWISNIGEDVKKRESSFIAIWIIVKIELEIFYLWPNHFFSKCIFQRNSRTLQKKACTELFIALVIVAIIITKVSINQMKTKSGYVHIILKIKRHEWGLHVPACINLKNSNIE